MGTARLDSGLLPRLVFSIAVALQLYFIVRGYSDPHKHFAFQPFNDFDVWRASIVRVTYRGARIEVEQPWSGYRGSGSLAVIAASTDPAPKACEFWRCFDAGLLATSSRFRGHEHAP
jgi:hypothetical protein